MRGVLLILTVLAALNVEAAALSAECAGVASRPAPRWTECAPSFRLGVENASNPTQSTVEAREGKYSLAFTSPPTPSMNRSEVFLADNLPLDADLWYGFSMFLPAIAPTAWAIVSQVWQRDAGNPVFDMVLLPSGLAMEVRNDAFPTGGGVRIHTSPAVVGQWVDYVIHFRGGDLGHVEAWSKAPTDRCYALRASYQGAVGKSRWAGAEISEKSVYPKIGIYRNASLAAQTVYFDSVFVGAERPSFCET